MRLSDSTPRAAIDAATAPPPPAGYTPTDVGVAGGAPAVATVRATGRRLDALDLVRGLVMVLMLLDHTRGFVHADAYAFEPTDLARTTPVLFLTRWVTHFCAPAFVFLAGISVWLQRARGARVPELRRFLLTRGLWLIVLEFTLVRLGRSFEFDLRFLGIVQVIAAIGFAMLALAAVVALPARVVGAAGVAIVALHDALDGVRAAAWQGPGSPIPGAWERVWTLLHQVGAFPVAGWPSPVVFVLYPVLAWIGVLFAGYGFGAVYALAPARRRRVLLATGLALVATFVALRLAGVYGDPRPFQPVQPHGAAFVLMSFVNTEKYPPSLLFLLMTLGPTLLLLGALDGRLDARATARAPARWLITFGRVPMFYYLLQWPVAHLAGILLSLAAGKPTTPYFRDELDLFVNGVSSSYGFPLWVVYAAWIVGLLVLYPVCRWYAEVKARRKEWWLRYV